MMPYAIEDILREVRMTSTDGRRSKMTNNETVREMRAEQLELPSTDRNMDWQVACLMLRDELQRMKDEMAAKDAEIAKHERCYHALELHCKKLEDEYLKATNALKPTLKPVAKGDSMTLDEAIEHAEKVGHAMNCMNKSKACGSEHLQLAEWLKELKALRAALKPVMSVNACAIIKSNVDATTLLAAIVKDARLIAAAPDCYDALQRIVSATEGVVMDFPQWQKDLHKALNDAKKALAKASGEEVVE